LHGKERGGEYINDGKKGGRRRQDAISGKRNIVLDGNSTLGQIYNLRASLTLPVQGAEEPPSYICILARGRRGELVGCSS
jgi:hypothetical protein